MAKLKKTTTRADLIRVLHENLGLHVADAERVVAELVTAIGVSLLAGDRVTVRGIGTLYVTELAARQGRNPKTGETFLLPARKTVRFKPSKKGLIEGLNA